MIEVAKKLGAHVGSGGLSALIVFQVLAADVEQAQTRADTAMVQTAEMKGILKGMAKNLELFMMTQGVQPVTDTAPPETVYVPIVVPDSADSN
jgi:hypothetical protein